ncbi:MAG: hypothetical protein PWQ67_1589 [Clostridia bacterium]|nr:hypothetical protein [Clostridia bacterium]
MGGWVSGVNLLPQWEVTFINPKSITVKNGQQTQKIPADSVIMATGVKSDSFELINFLEKSNYKYYVIGDAYKPGKITDAIYQGFNVGINLDKNFINRFKIFNKFHFPQGK